MKYMAWYLVSYCITTVPRISFVVNLIYGTYFFAFINIKQKYFLFIIPVIVWWCLKLNILLKINPFCKKSNWQRNPYELIDYFKFWKSQAQCNTHFRNILNVTSKFPWQEWLDLNEFDQNGNFPHKCIRLDSLVPPLICILMIWFQAWLNI